MIELEDLLQKLDLLQLVQNLDESFEIWLISENLTPIPLSDLGGACNCSTSDMSSLDGKGGTTIGEGGLATGDLLDSLIFLAKKN